MQDYGSWEKDDPHECPGFHPGSQCREVKLKCIMVVSLNWEVRDLSLGQLKKLNLVWAEFQSKKCTWSSKNGYSSSINALEDTMVTYTGKRFVKHSRELLGGMLPEQKFQRSHSTGKCRKIWPASMDRAQHLVETAEKACIITKTTLIIECEPY